MSITQKNLIENMEETIFNEVCYLIEIQGFTMDREKELKEKIKNMKKSYNLLLSTMNIKKRPNISLFTILTEIADKAFTHKNNYYLKIYNLYHKNLTINDIGKQRIKEAKREVNNFVASLSI